MDYKGGVTNMDKGIPVWEKYMLSVEEAAVYFNIGTKKIRSIIRDDNDADFIVWNGSRPKIKRKMFEEYIDRVNVI
jgi:hypothetical protein